MSAALVMDPFGGDEMTFADRAAICRKYGMPCIPLRPATKVAFMDDWQNKATTDASIHAQWNAQNPDYNCAMVFKLEPKGFWAFETDSSETARRYERETGKKLPATLTVQSRIGRGHRYFKHSAASLAMGNIKQSEAEGFSVRADDQYCVSPLSVHPETKTLYTVIVDTPPVEAPDDFVAWLVKQKKVIEVATKTATWMDDDIFEGTRDNTLMRIGSSLRNKGLGEDEIYAVLDTKNQKQCKTKDGKPNPLDDSDIRRIAHSVARYAPGASTVILGGTPLDGPDADNFEPQVAGAVPWGEPVRFEPLLSPVPPFKLEYLPESFRPWASDVAERMSVPLDYVGICMLCSFAGIIGRRAFVQPKEFDASWTEALNLLGGVIAPSGGMKTPTWNIFVRMVREIETDWKRHYQAAMKNYKQELAKYLERNKGKKKSEYTGEVPIEPDSYRRIVINDATPESSHTLMEKFPEGLLLYRDEIGGWVSDLDKPGREQSREMFLVAANGNDTFTLDRIGRGEVSALMCISFFGGMQPKIAQDLVNDERNGADGTIARFGLLSYPDRESSSAKPIDRAENEVAKERFRRAFRVIAPMRERNIYLKFSPAAQPIFNTWLDEHFQREYKLTGVMGSHFSKYKGLLPRLAAIFHLADAASAMAVKREEAVEIENDGDEGDVFSVSSEISVAGFQTIAPEHLERAITFMGEYLEPHMRRLYGCVKSLDQRREAIFAEHIRAGHLEDGFTAYEVKRKHWNGLKDIGGIQSTLETFCEMNWIRPMPRPAGAGRPTDKYEINPAVLEEI